MANEFTVVRMNKLTTQGPLKAFVDLKIGPVTIKGLRVVEPKGNRIFVTMPQTEVKPTKEGEKAKYFPIVVIEDKELMESIQRYVIEVYHSDGPKANTNAPQPTNAAPAYQQAQTPTQKFTDDNLPF